MNLKRLFLYATLLTLVLTGCQPVNQTTPDLPGNSMKGYELYSWQETGEWYFSVLVGTNREKTLEEIQAPGAALKGLDALQPVLKKIPAGQYVTWLARDELAFPPDEMVRQVEKICKDQGLELGVVK
jgi:hypothetical protein